MLSVLEQMLHLSKNSTESDRIRGLTLNLKENLKKFWNFKFIDMQKPNSVKLALYGTYWL